MLQTNGLTTHGPMIAATLVAVVVDMTIMVLRVLVALRMMTTTEVVEADVTTTVAATATTTEDTTEVARMSVATTIAGIKVPRKYLELPKSASRSMAYIRSPSDV